MPAAQGAVAAVGTWVTSCCSSVWAGTLSRAEQRCLDAGHGQRLLAGACQAGDAGGGVLTTVVVGRLACAAQKWL